MKGTTTVAMGIPEAGSCGLCVPFGRHAFISMKKLAAVLLDFMEACLLYQSILLKSYNPDHRNNFIKSTHSRMHVSLIHVRRKLSLYGRHWKTICLQWRDVVAL